MIDNYSNDNIGNAMLSDSEMNVDGFEHVVINIHVVKTGPDLEKIAFPIEGSNINVTM